MEKQRLSSILNKHWLLVFSLGFGLFVSLPFFAPMLMKIGWVKAANVIYAVYSLLCHQLPQRSFFLFGEKFMYSIVEVQDAWQVTANPFLLRHFLGNLELGWKVAWSDRMVSMYTSILLVSWIWYPIRKKISNFPIWGFFILLIPMVVDGTSHMISDLAGMGQGFRESNLWLAELTHYQFSASFYAGNAIGSFNSWMRLISGILFGIGVVFYGFPYLSEMFEGNLARMIRTQNLRREMNESNFF